MYDLNQARFIIIIPFKPIKFFAIINIEPANLKDIQGKIAVEEIFSKYRNLIP